MNGNQKKKPLDPPRWADRFLEWYCSPQFLEEIQGDAYELFYRQTKDSPRLARLAFCWNVMRFFRLRNIRRNRRFYLNTNTPVAMLKNILLVSIRGFLRRPGHASLNAAGLAAGFCCALLILFWVTHEFSFDRFHADPDRLFKVISHVEADGSLQTFDAASAGIDLSTIHEVGSVVSVSNGSRWPHTLCFRPQEDAGECVYLNGIYAGPEFFTVFDFNIQSGEREPLSEPYQMAISARMAATLYGTSSPLGKSMKIDGHVPVTIVSVFEDAPVHSSIQFDFVLPFTVLKQLWGLNEEQLHAQFFPVYIKTSSPTDAGVLTAKLNKDPILTPDLKKHKVQYQAYPLADWHLRSKFEGGKNTGGRIEYIRIFIVIGVLILFLAIVNYVNMATARATTRAKEIGVRKVTGAYRQTIAFQFLGESFLTVLAAFCLACFLAYGLLPFFSVLLGEQIAVDWFSGKFLWTAGILLIIVSFAAGIYPSLVMSSFQPISVLKGRSTTNGAGSERLRKTLLFLQLTASISILNFAGVMYYQLNFIQNRNLGFEHSNTIRIEPTATLFRSFEVFKNEIRKDPSIISTGTSNLNPLGSEGHNIRVNWPGKTDDSQITFQTISCSHEFPETIGLTIKEGRSFRQTQTDSLYTEVLVTEDAARTMKLKDPVGAEIEVYGKKCVIVGVVNDFHTESLHQSRLPVILMLTDYMHTSAIYVRYRQGKTEQALATVSAAYEVLEPSYTMKYWFQDETFDSLYKTERIASSLILILTGIAVLIAIIGAVSLSTFNVLRRKKEISLRRVFGASVPQVLTLLGSEFGTMLFVALLFATPLSWYAASQWLSGFVYHTPLPWWYFITAFAVMFVATIFIICLQALGTVRTNPTETLRLE